MAKTNSGLLEFKDAQKVFIALDDATSEVKKAVIIAADGTETDIAGGGGGVTVEALSVTENGTYSEEGKAYSPVTVNVEGSASDFSTAEVEFKNQTTSMLTIKTVCINNDELIGEILIGDTATVTQTLVLYKGSQEIEIPFGVELATATGDITVDDEEGIITISGAGTVLFQP